MTKTQETMLYKLGNMIAPDGVGFDYIVTTDVAQAKKDGWFETMAEAAKPAKKAK